MEYFNEADVVANLLNIKARIERSISNLNDEKERIRAQLNSIKELKDEERKKRTAENLKMYGLKISLVDAKKRFETHQESMNRIMQNVKVYEDRIKQHILLKEFEQPVFDLNKAIDGAIGFYSEDNLQMELMKRNNAVRERRVEYTQLESDIKELKKRNEEKRLEEERIERAETEKAKLAEEYAKSLDEEKALAEEARLRENYRQLSLRTIQEPQSFRDSDQYPNGSQLPEFIRPKPPSSSANVSETASDGQTSEVADPTCKSLDIPELSFSQIMRW